MEEVNLYIADTKAQSIKIVNWLNNKLGNWTNGAVKIPNSAPLKFRGKYFIKLPYIKRHSKLWRAIKNKVSQLDGFKAANLLRVNVSVIRKHLGYDKIV